MPNITILRVSKKSDNKKLLLTLLLGILTIVSFIFIPNIFCLNSVTSLQLQSVKIVRTADNRLLRAVIAWSLPVVSLDYSKQDDQNHNDNTLGLNVIDFKGMLRMNLPLMWYYYPPDVAMDKKSNNAGISGNMQKNAGKDKKSGYNPDYSENKKDKIYTKSVLVESGGVIVRNNTNFKIDIKKLEADPLGFKIKNKSVEVIILHTHTTESYSDKNGSEGNYRTRDTSKNVVAVGEELKKQLAKYKIKAVHDMTVHDYPEFIGAYARSLKTAVKDIKTYPSAKIVIDIHRDANNQKEGLRVASKINNVDAAKIMFVVGTNGLGLKHPGWKKNLSFIVKLQHMANILYPGLCREIDLRKERFNQQVVPGAMIVEVGGTGNTVQEAEQSMKYLAKVIAETVKKK